MNRQAEIIGLTADHEIQRIDRGFEDGAILIPRERIRIADRVLAIASREMVEIVAGTVRRNTCI